MFLQTEINKVWKIVIIPIFNLHLHWIPSPSYPALHMHWYCPILVPHAHTACFEQLLLHKSLWLAISHTSGWESVKESQPNENIHQPSQSHKILTQKNYEVIKSISFYSNVLCPEFLDAHFDKNKKKMNGKVQMKSKYFMHSS